MLTPINPETLAPPIGFSHAMVASADSKIVFLAGQTALNQQNVIVGNGIVEQFEVALTNILTALAAAGGSPSDLAQIRIYSVDPVDYRNHAREIGAVWKRLVGKQYPAMALVGVVRLWDDAALVEIEGTAVIS
jgi:enamine deaminase RidA (YjgF/YER057c/UK114 family)